MTGQDIFNAIYNELGVDRVHEDIKVMVTFDGTTPRSVNLYHKEFDIKRFLKVLKQK